MKKILLIASILPMACFCQQVKTMFYQNEWSNIWKFKDSIQSLLPSNYNYTGVDSSRYSGGGMYRSFDFVYRDSSNNKLTISATRIYTDENKDLEIPGRYLIHNISIQGTYKVLFPIWKLYFDNNANLVKTQSEGVGKLIFTKHNGHEIICVFKGGDGAWQILHRLPNKL